MKVIYEGESYRENKGIFLAGPMPRRDDVPSWRLKALEIIDAKGYGDNVFVPEPRHGRFSVTLKPDAAWEHMSMSLADAIVFWMPTERLFMPGLTISTEFGVFLERCLGRVFYRRPQGAREVEYMDHCYKKFTGRDPHQTLEGLIDEAGNF